ncbi:MAG: nuclease-related domain-containing protein [Gammaproteobacteria bacterium]
MQMWYDNWLLWMLTSVVACLLAVAIAFYVWLRITATHRRTLTTLRNISDRLLRDVVLPDGVGGHIGVDALLLRDDRLYVLVIRQAHGAIFSGVKMNQWTIMGRHQRFSFRNPLHLMQDQILALRTLVPEIPLVPRILFTGHGHFPKGRPEDVELLEEFAAPLRRPKKFKLQSLNPKIEEIWTRLCVTTGVPPGKEVPELSAEASSTAGT